MELTRSEAKQATKEAQLRSPNYCVEPLEAGMGGCPWRILVASILGNDSGARLGHRWQPRLANTLAEVLTRWGTPEELAGAKPYEVAMVVCTLPIGHRRARAITLLSKQWVGEEWDTIVDLRSVNLTGLNAVRRHVVLSRPAAPSTTLGTSPTT